MDLGKLDTRRAWLVSVYLQMFEHTGLQTRVRKLTF